MADYESLKVTELKTLLKERGVSATGLTKKAQYIQALQDDDKARAQDTANGGGIAQEVVDEDNANADDTGSGNLEQSTADVADAEDTKEESTGRLEEVAQAKTEAVAAGQDAGATTESKNDTETSSQDRKRKREEVNEDDLAPGEKKPRQDVEKQDTANLPNNQQVHTTKEEPEREQDILPPQEIDSRPADEPLDQEMKDVNDQQSGKAAIDDGPTSEHTPSNALYIRGLMRPLQAQAFREHLESLIDDTIERIHLDFMKTHAFVICRDQSAATTIRSKLHNHIWPEETQRRPLWIDFVPEDEVSRWIEEETNAGREARFSISYTDGIARLVNSHSNESQRPPPPSNNDVGKGVPGAPLGPRGDRRGTQQRPVYDDHPPRAPQSASFNKLDQYFKSTTARPKIYYQPATKEIVDRRLDELDRETSRDWDRGRVWNRSEKLAPIDQLRRYTFEDDRVVDGGLDFGGFGRRQGAGGSGGVNPHSQRGGGHFRGRYRGADRRY